MDGPVVKFQFFSENFENSKMSVFSFQVALCAILLCVLVSHMSLQCSAHEQAVCELGAIMQKMSHRIH